MSIANVSKQRKIERVRKDRIENCRTICVCSFTSTLHFIVPLVKVLHRLGTVQVVTEDKSLYLLANDIINDVPEFRVSDISIKYVDELILLEKEDFEEFKQFNYNIIVANEFLPEAKIDKFVFLNRRHHFREQIRSAEQRYIPMVSVFDPKLFKKDEIEKEKREIYVNEVLIEAPSYASIENGLSSLLHGTGSKEFRFNAKQIDFVAKTLDGIEGATQAHIKKILMEKGEMFANLN